MVIYFNLVGTFRKFNLFIDNTNKLASITNFVLNDKRNEKAYDKKDKAKV